MKALPVCTLRYSTRSKWIQQPTYTLISDTLRSKIAAVSTSFVSESECVSGDGLAVSKLQQIWKLFLIKDIPQNITVFIHLNRYDWVWLVKNATLSTLPEARRGCMASRGKTPPTGLRLCCGILMVTIIRKLKLVTSWLLSGGTITVSHLAVR